MLFQWLAGSLILGVLSHLLYFMKGEHHLKGPTYATLLGLVWAIFTAVQTFVDVEGTDAARQSTSILSCYLLGLYGSMIVYRAFFHSLHHFPGPKLARLSNLWHVAQLSDWRNHELMERLHRRYGDIVRIGPNEVAVFTPEGFVAIHGPGSTCTKPAWYEMLDQNTSTHNTRIPEIHRVRRRLWDQGLSAKALQTYQDKINAKVKQLKANIFQRLETKINCTELFVYFGFDVMGEFAFGESFGMLESNRQHAGIQIIKKGMLVVGRFTPVPWLILLLQSLPFVKADWYRLQAFAHEQVLKRIAMKRDDQDVISKLIEGGRDPDDATKIDMHWLLGDALTMIVAGSDTVSIVLTFLFYEIAQTPTYIAKLRHELENVDITDNRELQSLPLLNALINETLRLHPPVPTGPLRQTPSEGLRIGNIHIPGDVQISAPLWSLGRLESSYTKAGEFVPERWYEGSGMIHDKRGFAPFLAGKYTCVGKQLAMMEVRLVAAALVTGFDFEFVKGGDNTVVKDTKDCFTAITGPLELLFKKTTD
ncbi:putative benzoate 4-monooxygenase cytochrome P450 [Lophiostoma macrostomum CBS 122681]|uniref:Putative benzoate 4-monooxygenase cytochrome P450 n=1 Tax=Lophiostoma macrostomum CBS 122681 TaxID=1314788 RepID=A0A6A6T1B7_9PLEO|nr:putative benzoate 4-monooxygenase cytochrome P450 [Lophiostoma macrostomum CBS 122681]